MSMNFKAQLPTEDRPAPRSVETFIESAPDGRRNKASMHGSKRAVCITVSPDILDAFDAYAASINQKRGPLIEMLMRAAVKRQRSLDELYRLLAR